MRLADGIRKHGFRKWYERELLQSHAHLALTFLAGIGAFAAIEGALRFRAWDDQLANGAALLVCTGVGVWAIRRYLYLLHHAEAVAHQAECAACKAYGRVELMQADEQGRDVTVRCRGCGHRWRINS